MSQQTLHGQPIDGIREVAKWAIETVGRIARTGASPDERLQMLDAIFIKANHLERIALREAAFQLVCGVKL
jgi:hypothetical protein